MKCPNCGTKLPHRDHEEREFMTIPVIVCPLVGPNELFIKTSAGATYVIKDIG